MGKMGFVRTQYRAAREEGFTGFLDEIEVLQSGKSNVLRLRGWAKIEGGAVRRVNCYDTTLDALAGEITEFFGRGDIPPGAVAFEKDIPLLREGATAAHDYGMLVEAEDGRLFPIFHHSSKNVTIELEGRCNLRCVFCPQAFGVHSGSLSSDDLRILKPMLLQCGCIGINHQGESLISPKLGELLDMIPPHKLIFFNTNGTALKSKVARLLLENAPPVRTIIISIDAPSEEAFYKVRGTSLAKIMKNVIAFKKMRDDMGLHFPRLFLDCTVINEFMEEVHGLVAFAAEMDRLFCYKPMHGSGLHGGEAWIVPFHGTESNFNYDEQIPRDGRRWHEMTKRVADEAERLGVTVVETPLSSWCVQEGDWTLTPSNKGRVKDCQQIFRDYFFKANGNAQMCCLQTTPIFDWRVVGPMNFDTHAAVIEARVDAAKGIIPKACSGASCSYVGGELSPSATAKPLTLIQRKFI
jgi:sulfatase maturation enzyme AslB (radical SAM superfamily)